MTEPQTAEARLREHLRRMDMSHTERFEDCAERFYQQTGFLAPGKSVPLAMGGYDEDERERAWAAFQLKERDVFRADLTEAIKALVAEPDQRDVFIAAIRALREHCRVTAAYQAGSIDYRQRQHVFMGQLDEALNILESATSTNRASSQRKARTMSREELKTAAIECLAKAFRGDDIPMHVVQAATAIVLTPDPKA